MELSTCPPVPSPTARAAVTSGKLKLTVFLHHAHFFSPLLNLILDGGGRWWRKPGVSLPGTGTGTGSKLAEAQPSSGAGRRTACLPMQPLPVNLELS